MIEVMYLGHKPSKLDTVAGTGIVWDGHGDVKPVPDAAASVLLRFRDVWAAAGTSDIPELPAQYGVVPESNPLDAVHDQVRQERLAREAKAVSEPVAEPEPTPQAAEAAAPAMTDAERIEAIAAVMRGLGEDDIGERGKPLKTAVKKGLPDGFEFTRDEFDAALAAAGF